MKWSRYITCCVITLLVGPWAGATTQPCDLVLEGRVMDSLSRVPLEDVHVLINGKDLGQITDDKGYFEFTGLCSGAYQIAVSHLGCLPKTFSVTLKANTKLNLLLAHSDHLLDEVAIEAIHTHDQAQKHQVLRGKKIENAGNRDLAKTVEQVSGVSTLKTGAGISKPVVHGMFGNRLLILNNGVALSGQQWGSDHAPEIDPLSAGRITVVKGVGLLQYQGSLAGAIIINPPQLESSDGQAGKAMYFFESNGRAHGANAQFGKRKKHWSFGVTASVKNAGDRKSPDYFLRNTGSREKSLSMQLEKRFSHNWKAQLHLSTFNSELGILRGGHVGNTTDLMEALQRDQPFYTMDEFSRSLEAPRQSVDHHVLKLKLNHQTANHGVFDLTYAAQLNRRKEFDVRRSGRSTLPALSLQQWSSFFEGKYTHNLKRHWVLKTGAQFTGIDNLNVPETGILPLIPDYTATKAGGFAMLSKTKSRFNIEFGGRYDWVSQRVATFSQSIPREVLRYNNQFRNWSASGGVGYRLLESLELKYFVGAVARNPEINELYSNGLHQGVSGLELGNAALNSERSIKQTLSLNLAVRSRLFFESLIYLQQIQDYIYLEPQGYFRLTIRGAFPVFAYSQTNARLYGGDFGATYLISNRLTANAAFSLLKGDDVSRNIPLVYMPSNNGRARIQYTLPKLGKFKHLELGATTLHFFQQTHLLPEQDFVAAPPAYTLFNIDASIEKNLGKQSLRFWFSIDNLLNTSYRDYLDRQRYFADAMGRNLVVGLRCSF